MGFLILILSKKSNLLPNAADPVVQNPYFFTRRDPIYYNKSLFRRHWHIDLVNFYLFSYWLVFYHNLFGYLTWHVNNLLWFFFYIKYVKFYIMKFLMFFLMTFKCKKKLKSSHFLHKIPFLEPGTMFGFRYNDPRIYDRLKRHEKNFWLLKEK